MKLLAHHISTTSRPILMFCADQDIDIELVTIDLFTGEHVQEPFLGTNPNGMVPVLDDDGFILTESSAILKYIADKHSSPCYPSGLRERARVNEMMDWFNTNLYREIGYHLVYPQTFDSHKRASEAETQSVVDWGLDKTKAALAILDGGWRTFANGEAYVTGNQITIADYFGAELACCADLIRVNWDQYPNVARWIGAMKALPAWSGIHEAFDGFASSLSEQEMTTIE